jgi:hypothetical protein
LKYKLNKIKAKLTNYIYPFSNLNFNFYKFSSKKYDNQILNY